ncbi:hypothetical protein [Streptomyces sp. LN245]|uniref:hypothetical protein n=1 Tax=Streptomyces sp. LN245 TaxID=3112975 RepID=UPI003720D6CC
MLDVLGLEPDDEMVYRALVGRPDSTATLLSDLLAVPLAHVDKALSTSTRPCPGWSSGDW